MGFNEEFLKLRKKKEKEKTTETSNSFNEEFLSLRAEKETSALKWRDEEIAPVRDTKEDEEKASALNNKWGKYLSASDYSSLSVASGSKRKDVGWKFWEDDGDDVYDFVNNINDYRKTVKALSGGTGQQEEYGAYTKYAHLTDEEIGLYNYIYAKEGKDKADEFLKDIDGYLQQAYGEDVYKNMSPTRKSLFWIASGTENWAQGAKQFFSDEDIAPTRIQVASSKVKEEAYDKSKTLGLLYSAGETVANQIPNILLTKGVGTLASGLGVGISVADKISKVAGSTGMFLISAGNAYGDALSEGKTESEARTYSTIVGALETGLQYAIGGISAFGGISDSQIMSKVALIKNPVLRAISKYGVQVAAETTEEELQLWAEPLVRTIVFGEEYDAPEIEEMVETAITTAISTGVLNAPSNISEGTKVNGMTYSDAKVVDKVYKDAISEAEQDGKKLTSKEKSKLYDDIVERMDKGDIDIDTIEEVLGGSTFEKYKSLTDKEKSLTDEISKLENLPKEQITVKQSERLSEAREELKKLTGKDELKQKLSDEVYGLVKDSRLVESYNEKARKSQAFKADLTKYTGKQKEAVERAEKSGVLNDTNKSHALVDTLSKIEAEKGIIFDYTDNAKLKESGFAVEGKTVNAFVKNNSVTLNVQSAKSWQSVVGHEITHVLEGTEAYGELQKALFSYAESKGELESRRTALTELYKGMDADIDAELTADLVGDYLFSDSDFIKGLTTNKTVFEKVYDEIKYLCKVSTGKEQAQIEKVKREFDKVWNDFVAEDAAETDGKVNYSISETTDGKLVAVVDNDILKNIDTTSWDDTKKETAKKAAVDALKQFSDGIVVDGITRKVNRTSRREYTRSNDTENLYKNAPDVFADKMRAADIADDIVIATTNWNRDGSLKHPRNDNFVDFDHGIVLIMSGDTKYSAEVVVGITKNGEAVLYDVVDMTPTTFETKKAETSTTATTQYAIGDIQEISAEGIVTENGNDVKTHFSLSKSVEETKNLVALHNLNENKLNKVIDLGGFPMPSIAVTKTDIPHTNFGDITLVMNKSTVDPKANRKNTVYSADAWTPTVPRTEYKPNDSRLREISNKIYGLVGDRNIVNALDYVAFDTDNVSRDLDQNDGNLANKYLNNNTMKYAFLKDIGAELELPKKEAALSRGIGNGAVRYFSGKLVNGLQTVEHYQNMSAAEMLKDKELTNAVADALNWDVLRQMDEGTEAYEKLKANPLYKAEDISFSQVDSLLSGVKKYLNHGIEQTIDGREAKNTIDYYFNSNNLQKQYENWLNEMFEGVVEKTGIYNNKDIFTPSGNRRTFEQLHLPVTLDNIVKAMASQNNGNTKNVAGFNGVKTLRAGMAERFKSIADMHKLESRLQHLTEEEFEAIHDQLSERMNGVINSILETAPESSGNIYMRMDSVGETLMEIAESGNYDTDAIINTVNQYIYNIDENIANDIRTLLYDVSQMPTNMFEAKPERAVGFDEVNAAILPNTTDNSLRERLENMGVKVLTYEKGSDTDRLNKLNSLLEEQPDWKFSLSKQGEDIAPVGNYNTPLNELYFGDIAPTREDIAKMEAVKDAPMLDDIAPMTEAEANALQDEYFNSITDVDAPPETETEFYDVPDTATIDKKTLKNIGDSLRNTLSLTPQETKAIQEIVQEYSTSDTPNKDKLFDTIKEKFGEKVWKEKNQDLAEVKRFLRTNKINVSPKIKSEIADYGAFRKSIGSKLATSKDGLSVDVAYQQLTEMYPEYFSEEIWNETDQFLRMAEVANMDLFKYDSYSLDDEVIQEAVNVILNEVKGYKQNLTKTAAEETAREALDSIAPPKAEQIANGSRGDALLNQSLDNFPIKSIEDRLTEKLRAVEAELADNKQLRREAEANYNKQLAALEEEYVLIKDKSSKKANKIIQRVIRLERLKANVDADYAKRISDLETRAEKMNTEQYKRAMHKQDKMQEHAKWAEDLIGDTSTWKDKKLGIQYEVNTERRNLRDIIRDADGNKDIARADAIDDALNGRYNREEAAKKRELAKTRGKYADLKITKAEDAYIQMLGELRGNPDTELTEKVVNEYYENHKNKIDKAKVEKVIELARRDYDNLLNRVNEKLREQGMKEIPYRQGYFPHFTEPKQNFIQKLLNWKTQDNEIPTSIAGLTEDFKPVKSWQSFDKQRHSDTTDYSFLKGFDNYSEGALDWIYHIDTLQKRRAVENYIRYTHSEEGIKADIKKVYESEEFDADKAQAEIEEILAKANNPLNNFVQDFMTHTNILAGKKNSLDRTMEQKTNRNIYSIMTNVQNRMSANMVLANVRSALTNFIPITQSWAQVSPLRSLQATKDTIANAIKDDGMINKSTFLTNRLREADKLYKTNWDKIIDGAGVMFEVVDNISSQVIWRSKYNQNLADGMTESEAIKNADQFAENVMAGRSKGNEPTLFNAKNPLVKAFTMFQLEVNNQYGYFFKDVPNDLKAETNHWKLNLAKGYTTAFVGAYVYNALLEQVAGSGAALDPISIIGDLLKDLGLLGDDDEEEPTTAFVNLAKNVGEELPFVGNLLGGGRIPISSAIPYSGEGFMGGLEAFTEDVSEGNWGSIGKEMMNPILNVGLPVGGGQLKKTVQGINMFNTDEDHPIAGSYTDSGALRFPVDDTLANRVQAAVFGQYANKNAREYFDNGYAPLKEKQIQEFIDTDLPIADYWKYREGLSNLEPLEGKTSVTLNQKGDYIGDLDLPISTKNILINNIADDRKTPIDFTGFENYSDFEEFDFATRYPEKYAVLKEQGISVADYKKNYEETAFMHTDDYSWAADNPEQYTVSKVVTDDVVQYKQYTTDLYNIKADKDASGKSISGSRKEKVVEYVNNLDLDYGAKIILFKKEYPSDDTYNADIVDYLNNREDLTYEERVTIYTELGFTVKDGYVYWD